MNGDKKLAVFGIAAACAIGLINHMQYRNLAKRMEDLEVTVEMELFPDLAFPRIHTKESQEEEDLLLTGSGAMYENRKRSGMSTPPVTGESSLKYFIDRLAAAKPAPYDQQILLVHNVCLAQGDIDAAKKVMKKMLFGIISCTLTVNLKKK